MDLTVTSGFKEKPAFLSGETNRSPPACSQPLCPPSSVSEQPSPSASPSVGSKSEFCQDHVIPLLAPQFSALESTSMPVGKDCKQKTRDMYDPFYPTEGEKEERIVEEEEEAEKYDPFEPTGSPPSDIDGVEMKEEDGESQIQNDESSKMEEPPDSTDTFADSPNHSADGQLPLRRTVDCSTIKEEHTDSEHSEIEEGEIVGLADREAGKKRAAEEIIPVNSPSSTFFSPKAERILRVLDGDGFVSVRADPDWQGNMQPEEEPVVGVEDLRRKLVSKRKERYLSFPVSTTLTPETVPTSTHPHSPPPTPPLPALEEDCSKIQKSSKSSSDQGRQKSKDRKNGGKEEKRKKRRKEKQHKSKEKQADQSSGKESKSKRQSRSRSSKRKKRRHGSPKTSHTHNFFGAESRTVRSFSNLSEERHREKQKDIDRHRERDRDRDRDRDREREREKEREREREREHSRERNRDRDRSRDREWDRDKHWGRDRDVRRSQKNDDNDSSSRGNGERKRRLHSTSRERDSSKKSKRSPEKNEGERERLRDRDRDHDRERRRDGRPVVPPSIQDLNGSDLFAIKRTITVTTTTTTTTVPGSPRLAPTSPSRPSLDSDKSHRKKKRKGHSNATDGRRSRSRSRSLSPPCYRNYESDRYSDKVEIDVLSLDGEALDSDYPSLEDTPPPAPTPPLPSKAKPTSKAGRHQPKRKSMKKLDHSESSSSRTKSKSLSSLLLTTGCSTASSALPTVKRTRKIVKDKARDKGSRKELGRSAKSKKDSVTSRKGKLQSKVSVLVREGVSSTTGASGKLGMDLLGAGGTGGGTGSSVVGGSIAVVFCRDNESRSPFLKPCSEPLSLGGRGKDLSSISKRSSLAAPPSSISSPAALTSQKAKTGSITSTSSSASSPSSSLVTKRRRRLVRKTREKVGAVGSKVEEGGQGVSDAWAGASEPPAASGEVCKPASPHLGQAGSAACSSSSSSSSTSVLPPSSSPPPTPPPSTAPLRDIRESSPDSQTVDSSCKTPEPSFLAEECPSQTSPTPPSGSPSIMSTSLGAALTMTGKLLPSCDPPKPSSPPPCPSSSASCGLTPLSLSLVSSDPSSSSVSSSSANKPPPPPPPPPPAAPTLPWGLQAGVDCTAGGVLALTALLFKMEEANMASRAKAQEFIQATSQILSQANQSQPQQLNSSSSASQIPPPPSLPPPSRVSPQFILHNSSHLHPCAQTPPTITGGSGDTGWDNDSKDPDKYLKKLHTQERAVEEVKLAIKPYYQRKDINKDEYKDILRKAVHKICHSRTGEINPVKVSNLVKLYVQRYKYFRKHGRKMDEEEREERDSGGVHS